MMADKVCVIEKASKSYTGANGKVDAVCDISLALAPKEFVSLQGPSGCGKTTLLLCAGGLLAPDSGKVFIDQQDVYAMHAEKRASFRAKTLGFVFQQFYLIPYLSVFDNVCAPSLALAAAQRKNVRQKAESLIETFKLTHRINHVPAELSTGERQRTALARALLNEPSMILADEPTGNLDSDNAEIVLEHLRDFAASGGAVLLATHDARVARYADRSIRMGRGEE
jgi:putative ABC transport system ATP-binding protein